MLPKRILAELRDEQFDIYENRVAVRLVDHLNEYLDRRAYELRRICRLFEERSNYSSEARGAHRRSDRICRLWGELIDSNLGQQKAEKTRKEIESLKYRLLGLKDSFLYQRVPVRSSVPNELKMTNLLANDSDYREISLLWSEWSRHGLKVRSSPKQVYSRQQDFCRGFERFCVLVTLRALEQLRLGPAVQDCGTPIGTRSGESLRLPFGLSITFRTDGTLEVFKESAALLRIVSLPTALMGSSLVECESRVVELSHAFSCSDSTQTLILHMSGGFPEGVNIGSDTFRRLQTAGNEPDLGLPKGLAMIPVSPWEIDSVERVARVLRWVIMGAGLLSYPAEVAGSAGKLIASGSFDWFESDERSSRSWIIRHPSATELDGLGLDRSVAELSAQYYRLLAAHTEVSARCKENRGDRRELARLNRQKKSLNREQASTKATLIEADSFAQRFHITLTALVDVTMCPVCPTPPTAGYEFEGGPDGYVRYECREGGTTWGTRICGSCHAKIPVLSVPNVGVPDYHSPGAVDQALGCDVLAIPLSAEDGDVSFLCPQCGASA